MTSLIGHPVSHPFSITEVLRPGEHYRGLNNKRKEFRIALLYPKEFREKTGRLYVSCYTRTSSLGDSVNSHEPYTALSYSWGDPSKTVPIYLDNRLVQVTENLSAALRNFEHDRLVFRIWIDAICIDQDNDAEKSHQVGMMAKIFQSAIRVVVWLGNSDEESEEGLCVLGELGREALRLQRRHHECMFDLKNTDVTDRSILAAIWADWYPKRMSNINFRSTQKILQRPWFRRVWVLQEAALNENVTFYCGKESIPKYILWAGARMVVALMNKVASLERATFGDSVAQTDFISRRTLDFITRSEKRLPLVTLLAETSLNLGKWAYESTDPRDRVFAILGFSSDSTTLNISPDYESTCKSLYMRVAEAVLANTDTLDILYVVSGTKNVKSMPSWVPDWSIPIASTFGPRQLGRFSASGSLSQSSPTFLSDRFGNRLLILTGYRVDTVGIIMDCQWDSHWKLCFDPSSPVSAFVQSIRSFGHGQKTAYLSEEERDDALWRTPIADCDAAFDVIGKFRPPASSRMKDSFEAFIGSTREDDNSRASHSMPYINTMMLESARRRVFLSSAGYYGLGQETLRAGDTLCLLLGGDSPFIIRDAGLGYYELVGESYVHGLMHGEFLNISPNVEEFTFC